MPSIKTLTLLRANLFGHTVQKTRLVIGIFVFILLMSNGLRVSGSDTLGRKPLWISFRYSYGFIIAHHKSMEAFARNHVALFEAAASVNHELSERASPRGIQAGVSYLYSSLSDTRITGDVHAIVPWIECPWRLGDFGFSLRMGLGLGWVTNPFNLETNFRNTAIGSHLNAAILLNGGIQYQPVPRWVWSTGVSFVHFSNGSTKQPNYGINLPLIYGGVAYNIRKGKIRPAEVPDADQYRRFFVGLQAVAGRKQIFPVNGSDYLSWLAAPYAGYRFSRNFAGLLALDVSFNESDIDFLAGKNIFVARHEEAVKTGLSLGMAQQLGRIGLSFRFGYYLHQLEDSDGPVYDVLSLSCRIVGGLEGRILLKTHFARADFVGLGLSYAVDF